MNVGSKCRPDPVRLAVCSRKGQVLTERPLNVLQADCKKVLDNWRSASREEWTGQGLAPSIEIVYVKGEEVAFVSQVCQPRYCELHWLNLCDPPF